MSKSSEAGRGWSMGQPKQLRVDGSAEAAGTDYALEEMAEKRRRTRGEDALVLHAMAREAEGRR